MALNEAIESHHHGNNISKNEMHQRVKDLYRWSNVAQRTEKVTCRYSLFVVNDPPHTHTHKVYNLVSEVPTRSYVERMNK